MCVFKPFKTKPISTKESTTSLNSLSTPLMIREFLSRNLTYRYLKWPFQSIILGVPTYIYHKVNMRYIEHLGVHSLVSCFLFLSSRTQRKELDPWKVTVLREQWSWFRRADRADRKMKGETTVGRFLPSKNLGTNPRGSSWKKTKHGRGYFTHTWNPNDPCFGWKRPCFGGLTLKNRGHLGSRYI